MSVNFSVLIVKSSVIVVVKSTIAKWSLIHTINKIISYLSTALHVTFSLLLVSVHWPRQARVAYQKCPPETFCSTVGDYLEGFPQCVQPDKNQASAIKLLC